MRQRLLGLAAPLLALALGAGLWMAALQPATARAESFKPAAPAAADATAQPADKAGDTTDADADADAGTDADTDADAAEDADAELTDEEAMADAVEGAEAEPDIPAPGLDDLFGEDTVGHEDFGKSVERAYANPDLRPKRTRTVWKPKNRDKKDTPDDIEAPSLEWLGTLLAFIGKYGLWLLLAALRAEQEQQKSPSRGEGPQIHADIREDVVSGQDDVDDLLSSLGF